MKIKILFYAHSIDYAGTWRSHERILLNINKNIFDPYVFYNENLENNRLNFLKNNLDLSKIIPFSASIDKSSANDGYSYKTSNFVDLCKKYNFDILHFARGGWFEWPFTYRICPIQIETNIFGYKDNSTFLDYSVAICNTIKNIRGSCDEVVYNPIPDPINDKLNLKNYLNIPEDYYVFGRIGRPGNFHDIAFKALKKLKKIRNDFRYIIIGPCSDTKKIIKDLELDDVCIILEPTNDDYFIHKFHNSLDLFLHYRSDGECHSTAISQAMRYGIPIISHFAGYNGQIETIGNGGYIASNVDEYFNFINFLMNNTEKYLEISENALNISENYKESIIVKKWENIYLKLYNKYKN
jgi:glycosyltransferase involved in cell wall biosynthesis